MVKNKLSGYLIIVGLFTLLAVFVMVVQKSYSNLIGPINQAKSSELTKPINPLIDLDTLNQVENRLEPAI